MQRDSLTLCLRAPMAARQQLPAGSPGVDRCLLAYPAVVRQVSENTANMARMLQSGFSATSVAGSAGGSTVMLEAFSPVLPARLMGGDAPGGAGLGMEAGASGQQRQQQPSFMHVALPPSALSAHVPAIAAPSPLAPSSALAAASSSAGVAVAAPPLVPSPEHMLLSPNTQAAVATLASVIIPARAHTVVSAN